MPYILRPKASKNLYSDYAEFFDTLLGKASETATRPFPLIWPVTIENVTRHASLRSKRNSLASKLVFLWMPQRKISLIPVPCSWCWHEKPGCVPVSLWLFKTAMYLRIWSTYIASYWIKRHRIYRRHWTVTMRFHTQKMSDSTPMADVTIRLMTTFAAF